MKFKPKNKEKEVISFRISKDLLSRIDYTATQNSLSRNELMVQCIEYALNNIEQDQTSKPE